MVQIKEWLAVILIFVIDSPVANQAACGKVWQLNYIIHIDFRARILRKESFVN